MATEIEQLRAENSAMKERIGELEEANERQVGIIRTLIKRMVQQVVRDLTPEAQRKAALLGKLDDQIKHVFARFRE